MKEENTEVLRMTDEIRRYGEIILDYTKRNYKKCFRDEGGELKYKFIVPGSCYSGELWDWDSWLVDLALNPIADEDIGEYERGCVLNFLDHMDDSGRTPIFIQQNPDALTEFFKVCKNTHKPCLAQHALFISRSYGDADWIRDKYPMLERLCEWYERESKHESGLYFWLDDFAIGVDNDPATFYRPEKSSASIYLNCLMYKELEALAILADMLGFDDKKELYSKRAEALRDAIREHAWDERDGIYYSVDVGLLPINKEIVLHSGCPRHWSTLIQRIESWSCFMPLWAGIATPEQAERMVREHYLDEKTFFAPYGVRTLSKMEKMYAVIKSGNPSCWLGPIWGISNYMVFDGLRKYGFIDEARSLAEKTITLFGRDIETTGELHEYYDPESGEGVNNPGFQNWNLLSLNMFHWLKENG